MFTILAAADLPRARRAKRLFDLSISFVVQANGTVHVYGNAADQHVLLDYLNGDVE
jgi:hypothetical protein